MMTKSARVCLATGILVASMPPGPARDEILGLVRQAWEFRKQWVGRRPGPLTREVQQIVLQRGALNSFEWLLDQLEDAALRSPAGGDVSCVIRVNRVRRTLDYRDRSAGRTFQVSFKRLQNILSECKKSCPPKFPRTP